MLQGSELLAAVGAVEAVQDLLTLVQANTAKDHM